MRPVLTSARVLGLACAAAAVSFPASPHAEDHPISLCPGPGVLAKAAVPDPKTATAIFLAVEKILAPHRDLRRFPLVKYTDEGDHWAVFRTAPNRGSHTPGVLVMTIGGGQLEMNIAKCNGAISNAAFSK